MEGSEGVLIKRPFRFPRSYMHEIKRPRIDPRLTPMLSRQFNRNVTPLLCDSQDPGQMATKYSACKRILNPTTAPQGNGLDVADVWLLF
jgi:hypothetical protein